MFAITVLEQVAALSAPWLILLLIAFGVWYFEKQRGKDDWK
jgi:hypothetical protein